MRNANWRYDVKQGAYIVTLLEDNRVVYTKEYHDESLAEFAKHQWISGQGPQFLTD